MKLRLLLSCLVALFIGACNPGSQEAAAPVSASSGRPQVLVANYPLQYFAQRIAGAAVQVRFLAPKDEDPAFWQPDEAAISAFQNADLILMNGADYSKWVDKVTLPESKVVDTSAAFAKHFITIPAAAAHSHGPEGEHSHSGTAFTTWLDFQQAILQAQAVRDALIRLLPAAKETLKQNFAALKQELDALDQRLLTLARRLVKQPLIASHPVYHYLARRYGLNLTAVLWEPEVVPDVQALQELKLSLVTHPARWMIWEGEPAKASVAKLAELGLQSVVFDPCGNVPDTGDFLSVMHANVAALERALP